MNPNQTGSPSLPIKRELTLVFAVSLLIAVLMAIASVAGLLYRAVIYPTDELVQSFVPNDVVNLLIGLPILLGSMWLARRGTLLGLLFWPGALFYVFYTYLIYVLSVPLNLGFLLHLILVTLSAYAMISLVACIDGKEVQHRLKGHVPEKAGGGVLAGLGVLFFIRVTIMLVSAIVSQTPLGVTELALNIADFMITPAWVIGGLLLWRRKVFGYLAGLGLLFQASMLFIGLIFVMILTPFITQAQFALGDVLAILIMGMVCFIPFGLFVRGAVSQANPPSPLPDLLI
jgi:hypothetical protein